MPVEIRELIIKAEIKQEGSSNGTASSGSSTASLTEDIINICVEKVLEIIKEKNGR